MQADESGCSPRALEVKPGERVRFLVSNSTEGRIEVIVTDEQGVNLRTLAGYDPDSAEGEAEYSLPDRLLTSGIAFPAAIETAHDGHEDEKGPDATVDFPFRLIISPGGVRPMVVTIPQAGEDLPRLTRFTCGILEDDGSLSERLVVGEITGSGGR